MRGKIGTALLLLMACAGCSESEEPLPRLARVPSFELTRETGKPITEGALRGEPWVASFIFTRCPTVCPTLTAHMAELQQELRDETRSFKLVSFSVDPEYDTPEVLRRYAEAAGADPRRWMFVTGPVESISDTVVRGFKLAMGEREPMAESGDYQILHAQYFVLVDGEGWIRGYYSAAPEDREQLVRDVLRAVEKSP